jgi:hypothetical protein
MKFFYLLAIVAFLTQVFSKCSDRYLFTSFNQGQSDKPYITYEVKGGVALREGKLVLVGVGGEQIRKNPIVRELTVNYYSLTCDDRGDIEKRIINANTLSQVPMIAGELKVETCDLLVYSFEKGNTITSRFWFANHQPRECKDIFVSALATSLTKYTIPVYTQSHKLNNLNNGNSVKPVKLGKPYHVLELNLNTGLVSISGNELQILGISFDSEAENNEMDSLTIKTLASGDIFEGNPIREHKYYTHFEKQTDYKELESVMDIINERFWYLRSQMGQGIYKFSQVEQPQSTDKLSYFTVSGKSGNSLNTFYGYTISQHPNYNHISQLQVVHKGDKGIYFTQMYFLILDSELLTELTQALREHVTCPYPELIFSSSSENTTDDEAGGLLTFKENGVVTYNDNQHISIDFRPVIVGANPMLKGLDEFNNSTQLTVKMYRSDKVLRDTTYSVALYRNDCFNRYKRINKRSCHMNKFAIKEIVQKPDIFTDINFTAVKLVSRKINIFMSKQGFGLTYTIQSCSFYQAKKTLKCGLQNEKLELVFDLLHLCYDDFIKLLKQGECDMQT